jgi:hypothetical protein
MTLEIRSGVDRQRKNRLHGELSRLNRRSEICRVVVKTMGVLTVDSRWYAFRINKQAPLTARRVWHWTMNCDGHEFSAGASLDLIRDPTRDPSHAVSRDVRNPRRETLRRLRRQRLNLRVLSIALNRHSHGETANREMTRRGANNREMIRRRRPNSRDQMILPAAGWCGQQYPKGWKNAGGVNK